MADVALTTQIDLRAALLATGPRATSPGLADRQLSGSGSRSSGRRRLAADVDRHHRARALHRRPPRHGPWQMPDPVAERLGATISSTPARALSCDPWCACPPTPAVYFSRASLERAPQRAPSTGSSPRPATEPGRATRMPSSSDCRSGSWIGFSVLARAGGGRPLPGVRRAAYGRAPSKRALAAGRRRGAGQPARGAGARRRATGLPARLVEHGAPERGLKKATCEPGRSTRRSPSDSPRPGPRLRQALERQQAALRHAEDPVAPRQKKQIARAERTGEQADSTPSPYDPRRRGSARSEWPITGPRSPKKRAQEMKAPDQRRAVALQVELLGAAVQVWSAIFESMAAYTKTASEELLGISARGDANAALDNVMAVAREKLKNLTELPEKIGKDFPEEGPRARQALITPPKA